MKKYQESKISQNENQIIKNKIEKKLLNKKGNPDLFNTETSKMKENWKTLLKKVTQTYLIQKLVKRKGLGNLTMKRRKLPSDN